MKSFLKYNVRTHKMLAEIFLSHQTALIDSDIVRAEEKIAEYIRELKVHMRHEEKSLLPIYKKNGEAPDAPTIFFTGEHKRMLEFLKRIKSRTRRLKASFSMARVIALFDLEANYKALLMHHDLREKNVLYPTLDKVATAKERESLIPN